MDILPPFPAVARQTSARSLLSANFFLPLQGIKQSKMSGSDFLQGIQIKTMGIIQCELHRMTQGKKPSKSLTHAWGKVGKGRRM